MEMKNVLISIRGLQQVDDGDDGDAIELLTDGHYGYADGRGKLVYMESELTGLKGTRTTFLVEPTGVVLEREGEITSHMVFEPGKKLSESGDELKVRIDGVPVSKEEGLKDGKTFNVIVVYESTEIQYDENGEPLSAENADWERALETTRTITQGGE